MHHSHRSEKPRFGLSGELAQTELLATVTNGIYIDFDDWKANKVPYQTQNEARQSVKEHQPGDPSEPTTKFATDVYEQVISNLLKISRLPNDTENYFNAVKRVRYYTAVHSVLDFAHGIDAFFEIDLDDDRFVYIDLDTSINNKQLDTIKADVLIYYPPEGLDPKEDKKDWEELVTITANEIIEKYLEKAHDNKAIRYRTRQTAA